MSIERKFSLEPLKNDTKTFFCDDEENYHELSFAFHNSNVDSRFGTASKEIPLPENDSAEFESLCDSIKSTIYPKLLKNLLNKMVVVVNHGKLKQEVTIEKCR